MERSLLEVGVVIGAHGLQGLLRVKLFSGELGGLASVDRVVLRLPAGREAEHRVSERHAATKGVVLLGLAGVSDRDTAEGLRGATLALRREDLPPLETGEFYLADLLGCSAVTPAGEPLGVVVEVGDNGAQPLVFLQDARGRFHVPAVAPFVQDFAGGVLVLELPDGLREAVAEAGEESA